MDIKKLQQLVIDALEDVKGQDIKAYDSTGLTDLFDRVLIATGTSNRHTKALAASVRDKVKQGGGEIVSVEGEETGEWVLVDLGDAIVHIMQPGIRIYYNLEELWGAKPVVLKSAKRSGPARASAPQESLESKAPAKKTARKTAAKKAAAPGTKRAAASVPRKAPRKAAPRKTTSKAAASVPAKRTKKRATT